MKLLCANWKMNLGISESAKLTAELVGLSKKLNKTEIWVACSSPALYPCGMAAEGSKIEVGAQNAFHQEKGAFTGEISPGMLKEANASFSLIGHSERRVLFAESDETCALRAIGLLKAGIKVIFCIGETLDERQSGDGKTVQVLDAQLKPLLEALIQENEAKSLVDRLILAYEPVWAIGTGLAATTSQVAEVHAAIPNIWSKYSNLPCPPILYGGSMNKSNCAELLQVPGVAGGLIGGASNTIESFSALVASAEEANI